MKPLNISEINRGIRIFAINFLLLLLLCVLCVYTYFNISESEGILLVQRTNKYDQIRLKGQLLSHQIETIYHYMQLLNTDRVTNNLELERLISDEKDKLNKLMFSGVGDTAINFLGYKNLSRKINDMLHIKDSIRLVSIEEEALRTDLMTCIADDQQYKKKQSSGLTTDLLPE